MVSPPPRCLPATLASSAPPSARASRAAKTATACAPPSSTRLPRTARRCNDAEGLAAARAHGIDVIVVDHHQAPSGEPDVYALCNPHHRDCQFPFKGLASVGVAFYLAAALRSRLVARGQSAPDVKAYLDLVALGTIADLAPLVEENRLLVARGLGQMRLGERPGLKALATIAELDLGKLRAIDIGLRLAPRLNAPGRLGAAEPALDLLLSRDEASAIAHAYACDQKNQERRAIQEIMVAEALVDAEAQADAPILVVAREGWHAGVAGIVAGRLVDRYRKPAFCLAIDAAGEVRGSGRSVDGISIHKALMACSALTIRAGGHAMAAGVTLARTELPAFATALADAVRSQAGAQPARRAELAVELADIDEQQATELDWLGPFGNGNPEPRLAAVGLAVERTRVVGENHLQVSLRCGSEVRQAIGFGMADRLPQLGSMVDAVFSPEIDEWGGGRRVRLRLHDLQPSGLAG